MKQHLKPLWFSLVVNGLVAFADLVLAPLHAAGRGQGSLGFLLGTAHVLGMPGFTFTGLIGLRLRDNWTWSAFAVATAFNLLFWTVVGITFLRLRRTLALPPTPETPPPPAEPPPGRAAVSRRTLLVNGGRAVAASGLGLGAWGMFGEPRWFEVTRRQIPIGGLPPSLDGLRIVHLTDIHHCRWTSVQWLRQIVDAANALSPDVVALTGDYVFRGLQYVEPTATELARLRPRVGVVGVMGNHDWWQDGGLTKWAFEKQRIPLIDNARRFVTPDGRLVAEAKEGLCLAGVGDLWDDVCRYDDALGDVPGGMPRVLLSHNPDVAEEPQFLASGHRVDLMLAGHTHGGQIRVPGLGTPVTNSAYGQKYASGLVDGPVCPVYVSRGLGTTAMPVRFGARPEIAVLELRCTKPA